jgi:hypothetical protein
MWERSTLEGAWIDLQRADRKDEDIVAYFSLLRITLPSTPRRSSTMDNHVRNSRREPNGYIHVPTWFLDFLPPSLASRVIDPPDGNGLHRISCLAFVLFLIAIGYTPVVIRRELSNRKSKEHHALHGCIDRTYEIAMSGPLFS